jgi:hypothetical protein
MVSPGKDIMSDTHTTRATADWLEELTTLLESQHTIVDELAQLADRQAELIQNQQTDALLGLLADRQNLIERFTGTQADLSRMAGEIEARIGEVSIEQRTAIQRKISTIGDRLAQVMQRDERDQQTLEAARERTREELTNLDSASRARHAYMKRPGGNRYADRQG